MGFHKRVSLPRRAIPLPILISYYLYRNNDAIAAELIGSCDAVVEFATRSHGELQVS